MNSPSRNIIAAEVRAAMGRAGVNQSELAEMVPMSRASLSERLNGKRAFSTDHLFTIAEALGTDPIALMVPARPETAA